MTYHCAKCTDAKGLRPSAPSTDFLLTSYQRDKHTKHTVPSSSHTVQSVFDDPSEAYYQQTLLQAYRYGALEATSRGTDILFCPSTQSTVGYKQQWGTHVARQDTIRVVLSSDSVKVHAFLNASSDHTQHRCGTCGGPLF